MDFFWVALGGAVGAMNRWAAAYYVVVSAFTSYLYKIGSYTIFRKDSGS